MESLETMFGENPKKPKYAFIQPRNFSEASFRYSRHLARRGIYIRTGMSWSCKALFSMSWSSKRERERGKLLRRDPFCI
uniref:Uncharacterized protein n=1 Tax=Nelumbo nucifera TaxID=4432 RepID=A0A822YFX2_NELNU|nr:TPA_asm: hypothetical protein HUJ06_009222 [Nelumbo nucifera]